MLAAGTLSRRITLQSPTESRDSAGAVLTSWTDEATVSAALLPLTGREMVAAQAQNSEVTGKIRIRYRSGMTTGWRAKYGSRIYDILAIVDGSERHEFLELMVREGPNEG